MGGNAAAAADLVDMVSQRLAFDLPLLSVSARQGNDVQILSVHIIHIDGHDSFKANGLRATVMDPCCTHDDVLLLED